MIDFHRLKLSQKTEYEQILFSAPPRSCGYSFANLCLWGQQKAAFIHGCVAFFAHFYGRSVYPYPIGPGDRRAVIQDLIADARERGIPLRITSMTDGDREELEGWFPGQFVLRTDRDGCDYVYAIDDLADLRGRRFQKKRNHFNRFQKDHPNYTLQPLNPCNLALAQHLVNDWFRQRMREDPDGDYLLENIAMARCFQNFEALGMEGLLLLDEGEAIAVTLGSRLNPDTFDVHFEKAREDIDGAYAAINCEFARYLRLQHPEVAFLDREDDLGSEGLRKAKLSYNPHHLVNQHWAYLEADLHAQ